MMSLGGKTKALRAIHDEVCNLKASPLYEYRKQNNYYPVLGEGSQDADIMFIGEAPGKNEAETGRPFCGASGKVLDQLIESIGLKRDDVYITNIVKDRPPGNRDPLPDEIELYMPFLKRQIEIIRPKIIATLGRYSMKHIMECYGLSLEIRPISHAHGMVFHTDEPYESLIIIPLYHPAVALYNGATREILAEDFKKLKIIFKKKKST